MREDKVREALAEAEGIDDSARANVIRLLKEALAPEPRFYKNQPVLVRGVSGGWIRRLYRGESDVNLKPHNASEYGGTVFAAYAECKPDPDAENIINWIEHDGDCDMPIMDDVKVITLDSDGLNLEFGVAEDFDWESVGYYAVIKPMEFL